MPLDVLPESTATSGLTDAELRASAVPVSLASVPLPTGAATETTVATLAREGVSITGASMPAGGSYLMGWLSAIWKAITDRLPSSLVSGRLDVNVGNTATVTGTGGTFPVTDSGGSLTIDAPVGTPVFVRLSDGSSALSPLPVTGDVSPTGGIAAGGWFGVAGRASSATPTAVSTDDLYVQFWLDRNGRLNTRNLPVKFPVQLTTRTLATTNYVSATLETPYGRGIQVAVNVSVAPGGGQTLSMQIYSITSTFGVVVLNAPNVITTTGSYLFEVYPGVTAVAATAGPGVAMAVSRALADQSLIAMSHSGAGAWTYTVQYCLIP